MSPLRDELDVIRKAAQGGEIAYSLHAVEEMGEEAITFDEIHAAVLGSEAAIIESRVDDPRGESHLVCGRTLEGRPLRVVFGIARRPVKVVTVYRPDLHPEQWQADFRTRRRKS